MDSMDCDAVLKYAPLGIGRMQRNGALIFVNPEFTRITGLDSSQSLSLSHWVDFAFEPGPEKIEFQSLFTVGKDLASPNPPARRHFHIRCGPSELRWISVRTHSDANGDIIIYVSDVNDDVARSAALDKAVHHIKQVEDRKSNILANISHEVRTPMNIIIGMSHLALQSAPDLRQKNYLQKVLAAGQSLLMDINTILDYAQIESGILTLNQTSFWLDEVIDKISLTITPLAEQKGLEFIFETTGDVTSELLGDAPRLEEILTNLCSNAVKFTHSGVVVVGVKSESIESDTVHLHFWVRDTGIGIDPSQLEMLFDSFTQGDSSSTRHPGGLGLGLTISKRLIELMGGQIWVHSELHQGTTIHFRLPFQTHANGPRPRMKTADELKNVKVLLVDDNPATLDVLNKMLQSFGLDVRSVDNATDALFMIGAAHDEGAEIELIVADWHMPGMDGIQLVRELNKSKIEVPPVILMATTHGLGEVRAAAGEYAIALTGLVTKPVTPSSMLEAIASALNRKTGALQARPMPRREGLSTAAQLQLHGARILLVEDSEMNQELVTELLGQAGIEVKVAGNGQEALDLLALDSRFDGILMDCQMPVMDGYMATRNILNYEAFRNIPIIAMTANAMVGDRERVMAVGMRDHIAKPLDIDAMFITMARWITPAGTVPAPSAPLSEDERAAPTSIPLDLPGIDTSAGLMSMMNSEKLYRRMLLKFRDSQSDFSQRFALARNSQDLTEAERCTHTLRGLAANIGAKPVQSAAAELETACKNQVDTWTLDKLLNQTLVELDTVLEGLRHLAPESIAESAEAEEMPLEEAVARSRAQQLGVKFTELLAQGQLSATTLWRDNLPLLKLHFPQSWSNIDDHLKNFDFEAALRAIHSESH